MLLQNPLLLRLKAFLLKRCPSAIAAGGSIAANTVFFGQERKFIKGKLPTSCELPSVLYFSQIRSGSQHVDGLIARLYSNAGGEAMRVQNYFFHGRSKEMERLREPEFLKTIIRPVGYYFGSLSPTDTKFDDAAYKVVVGVRDPRDVMVSFFYSLAYAHAPSDAKFVRDSREARDKGLEWFVRQPERIDAVRSGIVQVLDDYWGDERAYCWRYEDMMGDFETFLDGLARHVCGDRYDRAVVDEILAEKEAEKRDEAAAPEENLNAHKRSGKSGTFAEKLLPETVDLLNREFSGVLERCGYL